MDEAGIDVQVLSHGAPSTQRLDAATGIPLAKAANDRLREVCDAYPDRLMGFAQLPTADPAAAADELSRSVNELGFKGAMIHGLIGDQRLSLIMRCFGPFLHARRSWVFPSIFIRPTFIRRWRQHI